MVSFLTSEGFSCLCDILIPKQHELPSLYEALIVYLFIYLCFVVAGGVALNLTNRTPGVCS